MCSGLFSFGQKLSLACLAPVLGLLLAGRALGAPTKLEVSGDVVLLPKYEIKESIPAKDWLYATCEGFEVLSDVGSKQTELFTVQMASFLAQTRSVCPELLLPAGTRLSIILATPEEFKKIVPDFPSPFGRAEKPCGVIARTEDTAVMVVRFQGRRSGWEFSSGDRVALLTAQATYMNDPVLTGHRRVRTDGPAEDSTFTTAVGEGRDFLATGQLFLKSGLPVVVAGFGGPVGAEYTFHDQAMRWRQYFPFPERVLRKEGYSRQDFPVRQLPPLKNLFAADPASPLWSSPLHRLARDSFVYWSLFENSPGQARAFLDLLAKLGTEPITEELFRHAYGRGMAEVERALAEYINPVPMKDGNGKPLEAQPLNFWSQRKAAFPQTRDSYREREASRIEISRITADFLRLVGRPEEAKRKLAARFQRNQLDDNIWVTAGLMNLAQHDPVSAETSFREAVKAGTTRPLPYVRLAALRMAALNAQSDASDTLIARDGAEILDLLARAQERAPQLKEILSILCELMEKFPSVASPEAIRILSESAKAFRYDTELLLRVIRRLDAGGAREPALALVALGQGGTCAPEALAAFARWQRVLQGEPIFPPADVRRVTELTPTGIADSALRIETDGAKNFIVPGLSLAMVRIKPGIFVMGGDPEGKLFAEDQAPATRVALSRGFWIGKHEITQAQWTAVMGTTLAGQGDKESPHLPPNGEGPDLPMYHVSWREAVQFCAALTAAERSAGRISQEQEYDLPTEAQWEYAARAGTTGELYAPLAETGWVADLQKPYWPIPRNLATSVPSVHPVGQKQPNSWGLCDVYGNVTEWCRDWYASALPGGTATDPVGPAEGAYRVVRGGSCWEVEYGIPVAGSAVRGYDWPDARFAHGFRVVLNSGAIRPR